MNKVNKGRMNKMALALMISFSSFGAMAQNKGELMQVGEPKNNVYHQKQLKGFANELPLITVMKQVTPNGWIVKKSDSKESKLDTKKLISWQGGKNWVETLDDIAKNYALNILVDWNKQTITLANADTEAVKEVVASEKKEEETKVKKGLFVLSGSEESNVKDIAVGQSEQNTGVIEIKSEDQNTKVAEVKADTEKPIEIVQPKEPEKVIPKWELLSTKTLKDNVEEWAKVAGYRLVWTGDDYSVGLNGQLSGEFDSENGPIKQLSIDYGPSSRVQVPLSFQFYQNKTLVVENWVFEQAGFPQYQKKD